MDINMRKEQFSRAYVAAVAAQAGCNSARPEVDDDSVDLLLMAKGLQGCTLSRAQIDVQLKCTENCDFHEEKLHYTLPIKNYNELREGVFTPRLLIVVCVPHDIKDWTHQTEQELVLRNCGYWYSLAGLPDTDNTTSVTLHIPRGNIFSVEFLQEAMKKVANGQAL